MRKLTAAHRASGDGLRALRGFCYTLLIKLCIERMTVDCSRALSFASDCPRNENLFASAHRGFVEEYVKRG